MFLTFLPHPKENRMVKPKKPLDTSTMRVSREVDTYLWAWSKVNQVLLYALAQTLSDEEKSVIRSLIRETSRKVKIRR